MKTTRKRYTGEFKAKVALEAIRGEQTLAGLAARHGIHPTMIATWKRQATAGMAATFSGTSEASKAAGADEIEKLHAKIGQLVVERGLFVEGVRAMSGVGCQRRSKSRPAWRSKSRPVEASADDMRRAPIGALLISLLPPV